MSSLILTSNTLIDNIKRRASIPENQSTFDADDFLAFANEELSLSLVPAVMSLHEDYFIFREPQAIVNQQDTYRIPSRSIGNKLRDLQFVDSNGNHFEMTRISIGDIPSYQNSGGTSRAYTYYVENNNIKLLPTAQGSSGTLLFFYYIRPNALVTEDRVGVITNINTTTGEVTIDKAPDNFNTTILYDMYMAESPHSHLDIDLPVTAWNSGTLTLTFDPDDLPETLTVGDHVAQRCEAIIPQIPTDLHVLLAQYVAERILESQGDTDGLGNAKTKTREMEQRAGNIIDNRIDDAPIKLVNRNSLLSFGLRNRRR